MGLTNVMAVAAGDSNSFALKSDGMVVGWGSNISGQTNVPPGLSNVVAISVGSFHCLALRANGSVVAWGNNSAGQTNTPPGLSNVIAIAAGSQYNLAVTIGGTVVAWGSGTQTNVPAGLSNVVGVAAGLNYSLALLQDGTLIKWGDMFIHAGVSNVVAIVTALGPMQGHNVALKSDGAVAVWGWDSSHAQANLPPGLSNVVAIAAGGYRSLAITAKLRINSIQGNGQNRLLHFHTFSGQQYSVQYSPDFTSASWTDLPDGNVQGTGYDATVVDTNTLSGTDARFYRIKASPL